MGDIFKNFTFIFFRLSSNLIFSFGWNQETKKNDSINVKKYINHIKTLNYISRKNASNPYFLDLAYKYSDSILSIESNNEFALNTKINIDLTRSTIENNVVNKFKLFEFYSGIPNYYGFVDDPIEYAYDEAIEKLINTRYIKLHNGPLSDGNITSILIRENCGDEMFEIVNQTLVLNTNHHILQKDELIEVFGKEKTNQIINGNFDKSEIEKLTKELKLERLGIFKVNDLDIVNNEIWFVQIDFSTFIDNEFTEAIFEKGVSIDKRDINFLNLFGILFLNLFLAFYLYLILSNTQFSFSSDNKRNLFNKLVFSFYKGFGRASGQILAANYLFWKSIFPILPNIKSFINNFGDGFNLAIRWLQYLTTPIILSSLMIFATSFVVPNPEEHFLELNVIIWFISSILLISFFPLIINLFIVNRLSIDGFHTKYGYQDFIAISLFATQIPFIIFHYIKFGLPDYSGVLFEGNGGYFELTLNSFLLSIIIGNAFYEYSSKRKSKFDNKQALVSLGIGIVATIYVNGLLVMGVGGNSMLIYGTPILIICLVINNFLERNYLRKERENLIRFENKSNDEWGFVEKVIDIKNKIFNSIISNKNNRLNLYIINANQGIGKTRALNEVKKVFNENSWLWFYGDCDEIQSESSVAFEPILQAFGSLLNKEKLSDRSEEIDSITSKIVNTALDSTVGINPISEFKKNSESSIKNICLEITEKLNSLNQKIVIVIEDLHWIDSDSFSFLIEFIKTVNRYDSLRKNIIFILSLRSNFNNDRGVNYEKLINEINQLNEETENKVSYRDLISSSDFIINDFLLELYNINKDQANSIQLSKSSIDELNKIFNQLISINQDKDLNVTPLYILTNIKKWIDNETLKLSQEGYILSKSIQIDEMPNFDEIDSFYHNIFDSFDKKWIRLLESATIIGNKFDADILSQVWAYNLLEVLAFLEEAVKKDIVIDLSDQDNFYEFKDQRIVSAIKSYFKNDLIQFRGEKQIIIEYNKRYLSLVKETIEQPEKFDIDDVIKVTKRIISLRFLEKYSLKLDKLILEIVLRYLYLNQIEKLKVFGKYLVSKEINDIGNLIVDLSMIVDKFETTDDKKKIIKENIEEEQDIFQKIPLEYKNKTTILNDLRLLTMLVGDMFIWHKSDLKYIYFDLINKIEGLSLLFLIKEIKKSSGYITMAEANKSDLKYFFDKIKINLINTDYEIISEIELELIQISELVNDKLFSNSKEIENSEEEEVSHEQYIIDKYDKLFEKIIEIKNIQLLHECLKNFMFFSNKKLQKPDLSIKYFKKYNLLMFKDDNPTELWIYFFLEFILSSTCNCRKGLYKSNCGCDKTGEIFIKDNPDDAKKGFEISKEYLSKIIENSTVSEISNLFFEAKKLFLISTKNYIELELLYDYQKIKIIKTYSTESSKYEKFLVDSGNEFENLKLHNKAIEYFLFSIKSLDERTGNFFRISQRYYSLARNFKEINNIKSSEKNILCALDNCKKDFSIKPPRGWDFIKDELIALEKDKKVLFLFGSESRGWKIKAPIRNYSRIIRFYATILFDKKEFEFANSMYESALNYMFEDYEYTQYNITNLRRGVNLFQINKRKSKKLINDSIKKLEENMIPENDKSFYELYKTEILDIVKKAKEIIK